MATKLGEVLCVSLLLVCGTLNAQTNSASPQPSPVKPAFVGRGVKVDSNLGNFGTHDFTVEFWMNTSVSQNAFLVSKREICNLGPGWDILVGYINGGEYWGNVGFEVLTSDADYSAAITDINVTDGHWHHIALTRAGSLITFYVDGVMKAELRTRGVVDLNNPIPLAVGQGVCDGIAGIQPYDGQITELGIYNRALSTWDISMIYGNGYNKPDARYNARALRMVRAWLESKDLLRHGH